MTINNYRSVALAALLLTGSTAVVAGQRIILIPMSSSPMTSSPFTSTSPFRGLSDTGMGMTGGGGEPPCRQRRLEPWRRQVRERCAAEADKVCRRSSDIRMTGDVLRRQGDSQQPLSPLAKEIEAFFNDVIVAPTRQEGRREEEEEEKVVVDDFESIFNSMLGFSLRAFDEITMLTDENNSNGATAAAVVMEAGYHKLDGDQAAAEGTTAAAPPSGDEGERMMEDSAISHLDDDMDMDSRVFSSEGFREEVYAAEEVPVEQPRAAPTPEQAAEDALDAMVGALFRAVSTANQEAQGPEQHKSELDNSLNFFSSRFFRMGNDLLDEARTRRRLTEGAADPRAEVKERLGRRLTEYRTDLFAHPDGSVTLLRSSSDPFAAATLVAGMSGGGMAVPPRPPTRNNNVVMSPPFFATNNNNNGAPPTPLGMNSRHLDECLRSRYDNGDLENEDCHEAVEQLLLAVDHRAAPIGDPRMQQRHAQTLMFELPERRAGKEPVRYPGGVFFVGIVAALVAMYLVSDQEEDDDDEEEEEDFDYAMLPEDDAQGVAARDGGDRAFVGIPVQVV
jgi:hypothetical protein